MLLLLPRVRQLPAPLAHEVDRVPVALRAPGSQVDSVVAPDVLPPLARPTAHHGVSIVEVEAVAMADFAIELPLWRS